MLGGACAALIAWLGYAFTISLMNLGAGGPQRVIMTALVILGIGVAAMLLTAPPVRGAAVALARTLLAVELPTPADDASLAGRVRGLVWACAVIVLGGLSLLALLALIPQGAILLLAAVDDSSRGMIVAWPGPYAPAPLLVALGAAALAIAVGTPLLCVRALERLAPRMLGPTDADRLAHAQAERRRLLEANALARDLHDSVGHALTAIGVQAEAGARVAEADPDFARRALATIAAESRRAITDLDGVLGTLRAATPDDGPARRSAPAPEAHLSDVEPTPTLTERLRALGVGRASDDGGAGFPDVTFDVGEEPPPGLAENAYRIVQEGLTNARRHGTGVVNGAITGRDGELVIRLENPVGEGRPGGGRGLTGIRERAEQVGGRVEVGPITTEGAEPGRTGSPVPSVDHAVWRLIVRLPLPRTGGADA
jgi:signal transduction histidine kinase